MTTLFVDPPSGWKYGFPKAVPEGISNVGGFSFNKWLVENGYPQKLINDFDGEVPCRFWYEEDDV